MQAAATKKYKATRENQQQTAAGAVKPRQKGVRKMTLEQFKARKSDGLVIKNLTKCRFIDDEGREIERVMYNDLVNGKDYVIYKNSIHEYRPYSQPCQVYKYIIGRI